MASSRRVSLVLFLDWDETISAHDTLSLIAPPDGEQGRGAAFGAYGTSYMEDLKRHSEAWNEESGRTTKDGTTACRRDLGERWNGQWAYLVSLDEVELTSQRRIEQGGLFDGFDPKAMDQRAKEHVRLRTGWEAFAQSTLSKEESVVTAWHVISVGWSARFIAAALRQGRVEDEEDDLRLRPDSICANEVEIALSTGRGTGRLTKSIDAQRTTKDEHVGRRGIRTAEHKVREMRRIMQNKQVQDIVTVYFGDSPTDLGCMVEAHVGVVMGDKEGMQSAIQEAGLNKYFLARLTDDALRNVRDHVRRASGVRGQTVTPLLLAVQDWTEAQSIVQAIHGGLSD